MATRSTFPYMFPVLVLSTLLLAGCAAGDPRYTEQHLAGFWVGLWHGLIALVTLIIGLFNQNVEVYERANNGAWYDLGFLLGVMTISGSGHQSHRKWRCEIPASAKGAAQVNVDVTRSDDGSEDSTSSAT